MDIDLIDKIQQSKLSSSKSLVSLVREEEKKKRINEFFFHEKITLTLDRVPTSSWAIPRFRLTPEFIDSLVERTLNDGSSFLYLKEIDGEGLIITRNHSRFNVILKAHPVKYRIELDEPSRTKDVLATSYYDGELKIILRGIPRQSQSYLYTVQRKDIERWLVDSILSEDPTILSMQKDAEKIDESLRSILSLLYELPDEIYYDSKGLELRGERAITKREDRYRELKSEEKRLRDEYEAKVSEISAQKKVRKNRIEFLLEADEEGKDWILSFHGSDKSLNEDIVLAKKNWKTCFLYAYTDSGLDKMHSSCSDTLVDITNLSVERVEHGNGLFYKHEKQKTIEKFGCLNDEDVFHFGSFHRGKRHGNGIALTNSCVMMGKWESDSFKQGSMFFKDGDIATNSFLISDSITDSFKNPYAKESLSSFGVIRFTDGAIYEGFMKDDEITGDGVYISAIGERLAGEFQKGILVKGVIRRVSGDNYGGIFDEFGLLHGQGFLNSKIKRSNYNGYFEYGEMQHGEEIYLNKRNMYQSKYSGYYSIGDRCGLGMLEFRDYWITYGKLKVDFCLQGLWLSGYATTGGSITNLRTHSRTCTTNHASSGCKWLNRFNQVEKYKKNISTARDSALLKNDLLNRCRISDQKMSIFNRIRTNVEMILKDQFVKDSNDDLIFISRNIFIPPSSINEAESNPGLQKTDDLSRMTLRYNMETINASDKTRRVMEELEKLEYGWGIFR